jgi:hypothetical protein
MKKNGAAAAAAVLITAAGFICGQAIMILGTRSELIIRIVRMFFGKG